MPPRRDRVRTEGGELVAFGSDGNGNENRIEWYRSFLAIAERHGMKNPQGFAFYSFCDKFKTSKTPWAWRELTPLEPPLNAAVQWSRGQYLRRKHAERAAKEGEAA
jgi:hypothetical protein